MAESLRLGDEVVISGIAGRFPESDNLLQLKENLFNKRDLITDDDRRWKSDHPDIPQRTGKVNNVEKFDSQFFGLRLDDPQVMDPAARMLLEHAYEAIIDAGVNPGKLRGTNTGVFLGTTTSESEKELIYGTNQVKGSGVLGCSRSILANRISHWLGVTGPSYNVDSACSTSLFAIDHAYRAIKSGQCDAALVGTSNLIFSPVLSMNFNMLGVLSSDGRCKSFDANADGYCRSEAICVIYLQKSKDARRIYADIIHTKTNCDGFTEQGITFPSIAMQSALLQQFYEECNVPTSSLAFIEAHGTGTKVGDMVELNTLEKVFCHGRTTPLRIGCIKSNLGHTEPSSGASGIAKVLIAMESGYIPPNLHYNRPREEIEALADGRMKVITELTPWDGGYVGVNSFGFGGVNVHVLLKSNSKKKINNDASNDDLPRLVVVSGRTQEAVETLLDDLESRTVDEEYISLFHNIHADEIPGHFYRGYTILPPRNSPEYKVRDVQHYPHPSAKRPVWFVFSSLGSPRAEIGRALLKFPTFVRAIQKCNTALKPHDVDIFDIFTTKDPEIFTNVSNWFVAIAAVQIGLVDLLASIGIVPDNVIGYSLGELGCAYADGCLSAEKIVLIAYFQGLHAMEIETIISVDLAMKTPCPPDTENAYHDDFRRSQVDWSTDFIIDDIDTGLQAGYACTKEDLQGKVEPHICSIAAANRKYLAHLQGVIPDLHFRSEKWLRKVSRKKCELGSAGLFTLEHYTNDSLSPMIFDEIFHIIPKNAIVMEIAPHGCLQTISRRSSNEKVTSIAATNYEFEDPMKMSLQAIGKMYELGLHPQLTNLYPHVQYPVSRGTPMIAPLIRWEHTKDWFVPSLTTQDKINSGAREVHIKLSEESFEWMAGHVIDGRILMPATGYLTLVWETIALMQGKLLDEVSVVFEDVKFHRATAIPKEDNGVKLLLMVQRGSGRFEVTEGNTSVVTGFIRATSNPAQECVSAHICSPDVDETLDLTDRDIYKELRIRGHHYSGLFRGLKGVSLKGTAGSIAWKNNWGSFMDNMLQMEIFRVDTRELLVPESIQKLVINTKVHSMQLRNKPDDNKAFPVKVHEHLGIIVSGGVEIRGFTASTIVRMKPARDPVLQNYKFTTYRDRTPVDLGVATCIAIHIVLENHSDVNIKTIEFISDSADLSPENLTSPLIQGLLDDVPLVQANMNIIAPIDTISADALPSTIQVSEPEKLAAITDALLVMSHGLLANKDVNTLKQLQKATKDGGFLLAREPLNAEAEIFSILRSENLDIVLEKCTVKELVLLLRKRPKLSGMVTVIPINNNEFAWLSTLQAALEAESEIASRQRGRILLVSEGDSESGLIGLVNCLRKEPCGQVVQGLLIHDPQAPKFSLGNPLYSRQLDMGLALNVLRPGKSWGSYRFLKMDPLPLKPLHHFRISQLTRGDLTSLKWVEGPIQPNSQIRNLIEVHYSSINFRDVMISSGKLGTEVYAKSRKSRANLIGIEFSGREVNGRAVMGMVSGGAFSNFCICDSQLSWPVPDNWTLEDAATVPVAYATAYYALVMNGKMKKGDKVLIHAGSGGVGQAAITLALHEGCEVFTTVGSSQKRQFIKDQFPQIDDRHIGNSRDTSFEQLIIRETKSRGVDIVLNSLADEKLQASIRCLRTGGRFLQIGKFDLAANNSLGMEVFLKGISFHGTYLDTLFTNSSEQKTKLIAMLADGLKTGAVKPLVRTTFQMDQVEMAFRYMAAGKHIGKVILQIRNETEEHKVPRGPPRYHCSEDSSYLILGGLGGFALELADWLVLRGAKKLVLTSRKGITTGYQCHRIKIWKSYGVEIVVIIGKDASTYEGCEHILKTAAAIGPVDAIFNLAVVLKDRLFENQTIESFEESLRVKAWATKQLDKLSRTWCPYLTQFVVFSSGSCGRGNIGQTNYGMSNSVMEQICERRAAENLPGLAIEWGAIGDVGWLAETQDHEKEIVVAGTLQQKISSCLRELDGFLLQNLSIVSSMVIAEKNAGADTATNNVDVVIPGKPAEADIATDIVDAVKNILGLKSLKTISLHTPFAKLGMDSIMAVEIKHTLVRELGVLLTSKDIRRLNFDELEKMSLNQVEGEKTVSTKNVLDNQNLNLTREDQEALTREKVEVHYAKGDHVTILDDHVCAAAIDRELVKNVL